MTDGFDAVAVRIEHECAVVMRVVDGPDARGALVGAARGDRRSMECLAAAAIPRGERDVNAHARVATGEEEERPRIAEADVTGPVEQDGDAERSERRLIERPAAFEIRHAEHHVINQADASSRQPTFAPACP